LSASEIRGDALSARKPVPRVSLTLNPGYASAPAIGFRTAAHLVAVLQHCFRLSGRYGSEALLPACLDLEVPAVRGRDA
jgi:hypothetical protein